MRRRWKVLLGIGAALGLLLGLNAFSTGNETKSATVTAPGGRVLELPAGAVQVTDSGGGEPGAQPVVLLHCYACSLHWFDRLEPLLASQRRVIRIDLLGHGGSEKPESGYSIPAQGAVVAQALNELEVEGAMVVGTSMGALVTASLAEQASQLVDRAVVVDMAPSTSGFGPGLPFTATLAHTPVLGEAVWRLAPDFMVRSSYDDAFAPGFDTADGFEDPDQPVADLHAMTYSSFDASHHAADRYVETRPLDQRLAAAAVPVLVVFGAEDQIFDAERALEGFAQVPGVRTELIEGAGHSPQVEAPEELARILGSFAFDTPPPEPPIRRTGRGTGRTPRS